MLGTDDFAGRSELARLSLAHRCPVAGEECKPFVFQSRLGRLDRALGQHCCSIPNCQR